MSIHKTLSSKKTIEFLCELGTAMDYHCIKEFPIEEGKPHPQAVDVAWFRKSNKRLPIFIFDVETSLSNTAANNTLKIYGKNTKKLDKPLYFFHIFLEPISTSNSSRPDDLLGQYGNNNYNLYSFVEKSSQLELFKDILEQHTRVHDSVNFYDTMLAIFKNNSILIQVKEASNLIRSFGMEIDLQYDLATLAYKREIFKDIEDALNPVRV